MMQNIIVAVIVVVAAVWLIRRMVKSFKGDGCGCAGGCQEKSCCDTARLLDGNDPGL